MPRATNGPASRRRRNSRLKLAKGFRGARSKLFRQATEAVDRAQAEQAGRELLRPKGLTWVVVGDLAKIGEEVRALGLGEALEIDAEGRPVAP